MTTTTSFRVASNNLMALPKNPEVDKTLHATPHASVLMVQEADIFHKEIQHVPGYRTASVPDNDTYNAFVLYNPTVWDHISTKFVLAYRGESGVSKTRHIAVTILRHKGIDREFAFISYHRVTAGKDKVRRRLRREGDKALRREVLTPLRRGGIPIILGSDINGTGNVFPSRSIHIRHKIDHLFAWKGREVAIKTIGHHTVATRSDHDALVGNFKVTVK